MQEDDLGDWPLQSLLAGERAIVRLDQAWQDAWSDLLQDLALRETLAATTLAGQAMVLDHLLLASVAPTLAPAAARPQAAAAARLYEAISETLRDRVTKPPSPRPAAARAILDEAWAAIAATTAWLATNHAGQADPIGGADPAPVPAEPALSAGWFGALWHRLAPETPVEDRHWRHLADRIDALCGAGTGLHTAIAGFLALLGPDGLPPTRGVPGTHAGDDAESAELRSFLVGRHDPWHAADFLARLAWPFLVRRTCALSRPLPLLSPWLSRQDDAPGLRGASGDAGVWLLERIPALCADEHRHLTGRMRALASRRRHRPGSRATSRAGRIVALLDDRLAVTNADVQVSTGLSRRGADKIIAQLIEAGVLRELTERSRDRVYAAADL